ncbi:MAG: transporter [Gemmataceae bacterium]|nr:transporter [Gemmataceae bacterium]
MRTPVNRTVLIAAALLAAGGRAAGQEVPATDRPGSPVETLEALTGERVGRGGREGEPDEIETDRDSFTPATTTVGRRRLVVESAYTFLDNRGLKETHSVPELLLRYGLTDRVELRLGWNYEVGGAGNEASGADAADEVVAGRGSRLVREYTLAYGTKIGVTDQDGWVPQSAVIVQGFTPTGGSAGASPATELIATAVAGWELPNRWRFDAAFRYGTASEGGDRSSLWAPSAVLRVPFGEGWTAHAEYFAIASTGSAANATRHYFSPGLHYLVTPDLEVGFRLGWGLNDQSARFFSNVGVGVRF